MNQSLPPTRRLLHLGGVGAAPQLCRQAVAWDSRQAATRAAAGALVRRTDVPSTPRGMDRTSDDSVNLSTITSRVIVLP
jgi:hypothetical protein